MRNILVYLFPLLMDVIVSGIFFITAYRFSEANVAGWIVGATMTAWALTYSAVSFSCGWFVKPGNSHKIVIGAAAGITLVSAGFLIFDGLYTQFLWLMLTGVFGALFFTPFQVYMKRLAPDSGGAIVRSTAMYTGSWSLGFALGPLVFGLLSPRQGFLLCTAAGAIIALGVIIIESLPAPQPAEQPLPAVSADSGKLSGAGSFDPVLVGCIVGGIGCVVTALSRVQAPHWGASLLHSPWADLILAAILLGSILLKSPLATVSAAAAGNFGKSDDAGFPDFVRAGCIIGGAGCVVIALLRASYWGASVDLFHTPWPDLVLAAILLGSVLLKSLFAPASAANYAGYPDLVLTGYIVGGVGCIVISLLRTLGPFRGVSLLHFPRSDMSLVLSVVSFAQSLTAFLLIGSKTWMYRKIPGLLLNIAGIGALLGFGFCTTVTGFIISAVFFGIYSGAFYFLLVFHSLVHPTKSARYLAGNETIVGATGIIAPVLGGALVTPESSGWAFIAGALLVFVALALQQWILFRHSKEIPL